jgi:dolichyldiphosphatase
MDETLEEVFEQHPQWKVFSLTYVEYPAGDVIGKMLALMSLAPLVIVVASVSVFAVKRDLHTMAYGAGMIGNGLVRF